VRYYVNSLGDFPEKSPFFKQGKGE